MDLNKTTKWADAEDTPQDAEENAQTEEELNALANVKCFKLEKCIKMLMPFEIEQIN